MAAPADRSRDPARRPERSAAAGAERTSGRRPGSSAAGAVPTPARADRSRRDRGGLDDGLRVTRGLLIPPDELQWRFTTSGGPGGQHANRAATRAEVRFDVNASASLGPRQRQRLLQRVGPVVRAAAADERSQHRNRELALARLRQRLNDALRVETRRRPTAPSAAARARRLQAKRQQAERKRRRSEDRRDGE